MRDLFGVIGFVGLLLAFALALPAAQTESYQLPEVWKELVGKKGYLEAGECLYVFTVASPSQVVNATVVRVAKDHVVIVERRDQGAQEWVIPLHRLVMRR